MRERNATLEAVMLPPLDAQRRYTIKVACGYLGLSHTTIYKKIKIGQLRTIMDGTRRFVPGSEIVRLSRLPEVA